MRLVSPSKAEISGGEEEESRPGRVGTEEGVGVGSPVGTKQRLPASERREENEAKARKENDKIIIKNM